MAPAFDRSAPMPPSMAYVSLMKVVSLFRLKGEAVGSGEQHHHDNEVEPKGTMSTRWAIILAQVNSSHGYHAELKQRGIAAQAPLTRYVHRHPFSRLFLCGYT
jgi:hypothetical protein